MSSNTKRAYMGMPVKLRAALGLVAAIEVVSGVVSVNLLRACIGAVLAVLLVIEQSITGGPVPPCSKEHR